MIWIDMIVTFIIAVLSGMGMGSGGFLVLYLTFFRKFPQLTAQGINLVFFLFASASAMTVHLLHRKMHLSAILLMVVAGLPAAYLGTRLALVLPEALTTRLFGIFLIIAGLPGVFRSTREKNSEKT